MPKNVLKRYLIYCSALLLLYAFSFVQYSNFSLYSISYNLIWICIGIFGYIEYKNLKGSPSAIRKSILSIAFALYCLSIPIFLFRLFICSSQKNSVLFQNKKDNSIEIVGRNNECYADPYTLMKVYHITDNLKWVIELDKQKVDTTEFRKVLR